MNVTPGLPWANESTATKVVRSKLVHGTGKLQRRRDTQFTLDVLQDAGQTRFREGGIR